MYLASNERNKQVQDFKKISRLSHSLLLLPILLAYVPTIPLIDLPLPSNIPCALLRLQSIYPYKKRFLSTATKSKYVFL